MIRMSLADAANAVDGRLKGDDRQFAGIVIDSRRVETGNLFVALPGERTDGHRYVETAIREAGAAGALVREPVDGDLPQIVVADPQRALGALAAQWRRRYEIPVIGVTGSNGKTTVKTMLQAIVSRRLFSLVTEGNLNNELGLPLTLSRLGLDHQCVIAEMGASRPGDIRYLAEIARPTVGLVNNAAAAHLQGMGSVTRVAETKGEMFAALPDNGTAILNADDDHARYWRGVIGKRPVISFGMVERADVSGHYDPERGGERLAIHTPGWQAEVHLSAPGGHNAANALAAVAAALAIGLEKNDIVAGLEAFRPVSGRLQTQPQPGGWILVEDSYNANPASLAAGVSVLCEHSGERWLVLGDMAELGSEAEAMHFQAGAHARRQGVERLYGLGPLAKHAVQAFGDGGRHFSDRDALIAALRADLHPGVVCLVKGSRSARMEQVSQALAGEEHV